MSYDHTTVDSIEKTTKRALTALEDAVTTMNEGDPPLIKVDGIPVASQQLASFCAEIRKVNRHVKFGMSTRMRSTWRNGWNYPEELYVYMEGHQFAIAKVGFTDHSVKSNGPRKYTVYARTICNEKYNDSRDQYYMATAENMERAIKSVKKYMRPYAPAECAAMTYSVMRDNFKSTVNDVSGRAYEARNELINSKHMYMELFHMVDLGYEFLSLEFKDAIVKLREALVADKEAKSRALHAYYVAVRIHRDEMVCDVIEVLDAQDKYKIDPASHPATTYKMEELPEHIGGSLAALSMVEDGRYVDGVGLRVDSSTFWVQR